MYISEISTTVPEDERAAATESACRPTLILRGGFGSTEAACTWWQIFEAVASSAKNGTRLPFDDMLEGILTGGGKSTDVSNTEYVVAFSSRIV